MPRAGGDDGRAGVRGGLGESQALNECRAGGIRWDVGSLGLVEEAWRGDVGGEQVKEL